MKIKDILDTDENLKGIETVGIIARIFASKTSTGRYGKFSHQFMVLADNDDEVGVTIYNKVIPDSLKGKEVTLTACNIRHYEDTEGKVKLSLDTTKNTLFLFEGKEIDLGKMKQEEKVTKEQEFPKILKQCLKEANEILGSDEAVSTLIIAKDNGWTSEDLRAVMISLFIQKSRA